MPLARTTTTSSKLQHSSPVSTLAKKPLTRYSASVGTSQQQLCDETRAQYEALLRRQETSHERQQLAAHSKLQDVLSSHISLVEHERILFAEGERHQREFAEQAALHARELAQMTAKWRRKWQKHEEELLAQCEEEKNQVLELLPPLELERNDALRRLKEQEIDQLTWSNELHEARRAREVAEARLEEACKHLVTLKARVKRLEQRPDTANDERRAKMEFCEKWQQAALQLAETKGAMGKQLAALEQELVHTLDALAEEKQRHAAVQSEVLEQRALSRSLETTVAELRVAEQSANERRVAERAQFEKELVALQTALAARRMKLQRVREQLTAEEQRARACDMRGQALGTKLEALEQCGREREAKWRRQRQQLRARVTQLESLVRELQAQQQEQEHDEQLSRLLFGGE